jgi:hypothetical protein
VLLSEDPPQKTPLDVAPRILEEMGDLIPVLDRSQNGWWRLAVLAIVAAVAISGVAIVLKMEGVRFPQPVQHDSACHLSGDSIICE